MLLLTVLCNHIVFSEAVYLRAHKSEPFLVVSVTVGVLTAAGTVILGWLWGSTGVTIGYFFTSDVLGLVLGTTIFLARRSEWHAEPVSASV